MPEGTPRAVRVVYRMMDAHKDDFSAYASGRWAALVRSAMLLGCSQADAEDLAQSALVKTWMHWRRVKQAVEPDAYVYRIMVNTLFTNRRRKWHGEEPTLQLPDHVEGDRTSHVALREAVVAALRTLPEDQQQVLVLRYVADLTERATAEALGIAIGTVKSRASRGIAALDPTLLADFAEDN